MKKWREIRREVGLEGLGKGLRTASTASMWLAELRSRAGVTQVDLAARLGVSQSRISQIEDEPDVRISTIASYVAALGAPCASLPPCRAARSYAWMRYRQTRKTRRRRPWPRSAAGSGVTGAALVDLLSPGAGSATTSRVPMRAPLHHFEK
jgi:DNA-binding XRE family transcriptional regulator